MEKCNLFFHIEKILYSESLDFALAGEPLADLDGDLDALLGDLDALLGDLDALFGDLDALLGDPEALLGDLEALLGEPEALLGDLDPLFGERDPLLELRDAGDLEPDLDLERDADLERDLEDRLEPASLSAPLAFSPAPEPSSSDSLIGFFVLAFSSRLAFVNSMSLSSSSEEYIGLVSEKKITSS